VGVDPLSDLIAPHVVIVAGKGGVGKTTVTAGLASAAASRGRRVLAVELDGKPNLAEWLDGVDGVEVMAISPAEALDGYLREQGFARIARRLSATGVIDVVGTAAPGIDDLVVLGRIKQLERSGDYDLIVVDGPAAGHALTMLTAASGLGDSVDSGPVRAQADEVRALLADPQRCQVVLVAIPETTPVNEIIETAYAIEDRVGVQLGPVVVNLVEADAIAADRDRDRAGDAESPEPGVVGSDMLGAITEALGGGRIDDDEAAALAAVVEFGAARAVMQLSELARLRERLALPVVVLPALETTDGDHIAVLARWLSGNSDDIDAKDGGGGISDG
jgi:arsenite-transporting ATPase